MQIDKLVLIYFSPTHGSQKIVRAVADGIGWACREEVDLTTDVADSPIVLENALCLFSTPVYGGLMPPVARLRFARLKAVNCAAVFTCTYGNRDYEDTLVQMREQLEHQGFVALSAASFVAEHSFSRAGFPIAKGRPDVQDLDRAKEFGQHSVEKLQRALQTTLQPSEHHRMALQYSEALCTALPAFYIKGNVPCKTLPPTTPQKPVVSDSCNACGLCADLCPMHAISLADGRSHTDIDRCIKCCACVKECPVGARTFDTPYTQKLNALCAQRRDVETFL